MKRYKYIIFDVDDTLLDFGRTFRNAQRDMAALLKVEYTEEYRQTAEKCGYRAWRECGMENTSDENVQKNYHHYYFDYLQRQCRYLKEEFGSSIEESKLLKCYLESVSASEIMMEPETLNICRALSEKYRLVLATNGIEDMQKRRTATFSPYVYRLYISETVGAIKPSGAFFEHILDDLGCKAGDCLMVGDSLTNDIIGAENAGMDVCWYNPKHRPVPENIAIDHVIYSLNELTDILL